MTLDSTYTALWIVITLAAIALETCALLRPPGAPNGTLTWNVRKLFALGSKTKWTGRIILALILAWTIFHFMTPAKP